MGARHHYVSQFHLRWFVDPASDGTSDPWLWVGDREQQSVSRRAPKNVGWSRGIFDGPGAFANRDLRLEDFFTNQVEAPAARALRKWVELPQGTRSEIPPVVLRYLAWAAARSLPMRQLYEEWLNAVPANAECVEPPPPGYEMIEWSEGGLCMEHPQLGTREDVRREEVDSLRALGWQACIRSSDFGEAIHQQAWYFQARWFPRLRWACLDAPAGTSFVIGDRPVVWGVRRMTDSGWTIAADVPPYYLRDLHVQLVAPLTRSIALLASHAESPLPGRVPPSAINRIVAAGAQRWVFGATQGTVDASIQ